MNLLRVLRVDKRLEAVSEEGGLLISVDLDVVGQQKRLQVIVVVIVAVATAPSDFQVVLIDNHNDCFLCSQNTCKPDVVVVVGLDWLVAQGMQESGLVGLFVLKRVFGWSG